MHPFLLPTHSLAVVPVTHPLYPTYNNLITQSLPNPHHIAALW